MAPRRRGSHAGRVLLLAACALFAVGVWLAFGVAETSRQAGVAAFVSPAPRAPAADSKAPPHAAVTLDASDSLKVKLRPPPEAGLVFDLDTGEVLWRLDPRQRLPIASLTKIMTALIVVDRAKPERAFKVTRDALDFSGSAVGLPTGEKVKVESLLAATLIQSAGDAARTLAIGVAGSEAKFVRLMNRRASQLGLRCTHFSSSDGLSAANRSCPADVAALSRLAMDEPRIARLVRKPRAIVPVPVPGGEQHLASTNPLLETGYRGTIGLKTGYTERAGRCLVVVVRREGRTLGAVLIDSRDPGSDARALLDKAFARAR